MAWDLPSTNDINAFRCRDECSTAVMDTFGKVFYDSHYSEVWQRLRPSDDPPPLFLPHQDLHCLRADFDSDPTKPPQEILGDSEVHIRSEAIVKVAQLLESNLGPISKVSSFLFFMPLMSPGNPNTEHWIRVHYRPIEPSLAIFASPDDKNVFISDANRNLALLASILRIINHLWDYCVEPHTFSKDNITWLSDKNLSANFCSGLANVLHLYSTIYPDKFPFIANHLRGSVVACLHELLMDVCPNAQKQKCDFEEERQRKIQKVKY